MAKATGYVLTKEEAGRVQSVVEHVEQSPAYVRAARVRKPRNVGSIIRDAILDADMSAASDALTGAVTVDAHFLEADPANPGDLKAGTAFTVTNRSIDAGAGSPVPSGTYIQVAWMVGEWRPVWIDCD